jgi:hypothetical protein
VSASVHKTVTLLTPLGGGLQVVYDYSAICIIARKLESVICVSNVRAAASNQPISDIEKQT